MPIFLALALAAAPVPPAKAAPPSEAEVLIANCNAHKFETTVDVLADGVPHKSRVKICGKVGQSDSDWVVTLKDSLAKVQGNERMPQSVKDQLTAALTAEIARLNASTIAPRGLVAGPLPSIASKPEAIPTPATPAPEYTTLPAFPPPRPAESAVVAASLPLLPAPRLTFSCLNTGSLGEGPCDDLERDTLLTVKAGENLPPGTSLRFVRRGDFRGEVELAQLRKGQSMRMNLPEKVCLGVVGSQVEIQVVRKPPGAAGEGQVVNTLGPYELRC